MRHVYLPTCISRSEGHACRLFQISCENCDRQPVGCSEDVTDGLSLSRNVCCLQLADQNNTPSPQLILHLNVHFCSGHGVGGRAAICMCSAVNCVNCGVNWREDSKVGIKGVTGECAVDLAEYCWHLGCYTLCFDR
jgi:hypothetical protein